MWSLRLIEFSFAFLYLVVLFLSYLKVYIVGHMPPGSDERQIGLIPNGHSTYSEKNNLRYLRFVEQRTLFFGHFTETSFLPIRLIRKYSSIIQGQFFGHLHSDSFRIVYNDMGKAFFNPSFPSHSSALFYFFFLHPQQLSFNALASFISTFFCFLRYPFPSSAVFVRFVNILNIYFSFVKC